MNPELDLEGARVVFLVDGDAGGKVLHDALVDAGVSEERIATLGALTLENLLDPYPYKQTVEKLINETAGSEKVAIADLPELPVNSTTLWPKVIQDWATQNGHGLPGKRVIASRLVEDRLAFPSEWGAEVLKKLHKELTQAFDSRA